MVMVVRSVRNTNLLHRIGIIATTVLVAGGLLSATPAAAVTGAPVSWSSPITLASGNVGAGLACRPGLCAGAAANPPAIVTSTHPDGTASAWASSGFTDAAQQLHGMSCPSTTLCVTVDGFYVAALISTTPTSGAADWHQAGLAGGPYSPQAVSCPTTTLCVVVDAHGGVYFSTSPSSTSAWSSRVPITSYNDSMDAVSCATTTLCVAVDLLGRAVVSTTPTGGPDAWKVFDIDGTNKIFGVSCVAKPMCVAVDQTGKVLSSTNPAAASPAWKRVTVDSGHQLKAVSCPSAGLCVAVDDAGNAFVSTNPTGAASAWTKTNIDGTTALTVVSCTSSLCVAGDAAGDVIHGTVNTFKPDASIGKWTSTTLIGSKIYSATAARETLAVNVRRDGSQSFKVVVTNRGNVADKYVIKGPGNQGWTVTYSHGTTNITSAVEAGTYQPTVAVGATDTIKMVIKVPKSAAVGSTKSWLVLAKSANNPSAMDAVKASVQSTT